ncbi:MAG: hypothetical protein AAFW68_09525 [Pseudomonadota bacterium]
MKSTSPVIIPVIKRTLTSLAAIAAVSAIFGLKAIEWETRAAAHQGDQDRLARASLDPAS